MSSRRLLLGTGILVLLTFVTLAFAGTQPQLAPEGMPGKMKAAIQKSLADKRYEAKTRQVIKPGAEQGYLGIPNAPQPSLIVGFL